MNAFRLVCLSAFAAVAPGVRGQAPITSKSWVWDKLEFKPTAIGARAEVNNGPTATLRVFESHVTTLNAGLDSHAPHTHAQEEFIVIKEGTLEIHINDRPPQRVGPGSVYFFASLDRHNVTNVGTTPATYLVFNFQTAGTASAPTEGTEKAMLAGKLKGTLGSRVYDWENLTYTKNDKGGRRELMNAPTTTSLNLEGHVTTLNPGEMPHAGHSHPDEEMVVVKEGTMETTVDGVVTRGGPGSIFFFGSGSFHGLKNVGTTTATYYIFRFVNEATPKAPATTEKL